MAAYSQRGWRQDSLQPVWREAGKLTDSMAGGRAAYSQHGGRQGSLQAAWWEVRQHTASVVAGDRSLELTSLTMSTDSKLEMGRL